MGVKYYVDYHICHNHNKIGLKMEFFFCTIWDTHWYCLRKFKNNDPCVVKSVICSICEAFTQDHWMKLQTGRNHIAKPESSDTQATDYWRTRPKGVLVPCKAIRDTSSALQFMKVRGHKEIPTQTHPTAGLELRSSPSQVLM